MNVMSEHYHLKGARLLDPSTEQDETKDLYIIDGILHQTQPNPLPKNIKTLEVNDCIICPGFIDLAHHCREPGYEHKGTLATELYAATANGFTQAITFAHTNPINDSAAITRLLLEKSQTIDTLKLFPVGALTKNLAGEQLSEMASLKTAGCIGVSNDPFPLKDHLTLLRAYEYAYTQNLLVFSRPEDFALSETGCAHDGPIAARLGLPVIPSCSEALAVARDLLLMKHTQVSLHFSRISSHESLELIKHARNQGLAVTCDVSIANLLFTEHDIEGFNVLYHVRPPLRGETDRQSLLAGLRDGTISAICSDHQPHERAAKMAPFSNAEPGMATLDGFLPKLLKLSQQADLPLNTLIRALTTGPAHCINQPLPSLDHGASANLTLFKPNHKWSINHSNQLSHGANAPFLNQNLLGKTLYTFHQGKMLYSHQHHDSNCQKSNGVRFD